jgi:hypothetical protein
LYRSTESRTPQSIHGWQLRIEPSRYALGERNTNMSDPQAIAAGYAMISGLYQNCTVARGGNLANGNIVAPTRKAILLDPGIVNENILALDGRRITRIKPTNKNTGLAISSPDGSRTYNSTVYAGITRLGTFGRAEQWPSVGFVAHEWGFEGD